MSAYQVPEPILNNPLDEPQEHWHIVEGETPERMPGRRPAMYFYRDPKVKPDKEAGGAVGTAIELTLVNRIREQVNPKPDAILKYAHHPIAMLGALWEKETEDWNLNREDPRRPVFILVCKNTQIAKVLYEWLAEDKAPTGIPPVKIEGFRNKNDLLNTIRVDSKVVHESTAARPRVTRSGGCG